MLKSFEDFLFFVYKCDLYKMFHTETVKRKNTQWKRSRESVFDVCAYTGADGADSRKYIIDSTKIDPVALSQAVKVAKENNMQSASEGKNQPKFLKTGGVLKLVDEMLCSFVDIYVKTVYHEIDHYLYGRYYECAAIKTIYEIEKTRSEQLKCKFPFYFRVGKNSHSKLTSMQKRYHEVAHQIARALRHLHPTCMRKLIQSFAFEYKNETIEVKTHVLAEILREELLIYDPIMNENDIRYVNYILHDQELLTAVCVGLTNLGDDIMLMEWGSSWNVSFYAWMYDHGPFYFFLHGTHQRMHHGLKLQIQNQDGIVENEIDCSEDFAQLVTLTNNDIRNLIVQMWDPSYRRNFPHENGTEVDYKQYIWIATNKRLSTETELIVKTVTQNLLQERDRFCEEHLDKIAQGKIHSERVNLFYDPLFPSMSRSLFTNKLLQNIFLSSILHILEGGLPFNASNSVTVKLFQPQKQKTLEPPQESEVLVQILSQQKNTTSPGLSESSESSKSSAIKPRRKQRGDPFKNFDDIKIPSGNPYIVHCFDLSGFNLAGRDNPKSTLDMIDEKYDETQEKIPDETHEEISHETQDESWDEVQEESEKTLNHVVTHEETFEQEKTFEDIYKYKTRADEAILAHAQHRHGHHKHHGHHGHENSAAQKLFKMEEDRLRNHLLERQRTINDTMLKIYGADDAENQYLARIWKFEYKFVEQTVEKWKKQILDAQQAIRQGKSEVKSKLEERLEELRELYSELADLEMGDKLEGLGQIRSSERNKVQKLAELAETYRITHERMQKLTAKQIDTEIKILRCKNTEMDKFEEVQKEVMLSIKKYFPTQEQGIFGTGVQSVIIKQQKSQSKIKNLEETINVFKRDFNLRLSLDIVAFNYTRKKYIYDKMLKIAFLEYKLEKLEESIDGDKEAKFLEESVDEWGDTHEESHKMQEKARQWHGIEKELHDTRKTLRQYLHTPVPEQWNFWLTDNRAKHNKLTNEEMQTELERLTQEESIVDEQFRMKNIGSDDGKNYFDPLPSTDQEYENVTKDIREYENLFVSNTKDRLREVFLHGNDESEIVKFVARAMMDTIMETTSDENQNVALKLAEAELFKQTRVRLATLSASAFSHKIFTLFHNLHNAEENRRDRMQASFEDVMWEKFRLWNVVWRNKSAAALQDMQDRFDYFHDIPTRFEQKQAEDLEARKRAGFTTEEKNISLVNKKERFVEQTIEENLRQWFDVSETTLTLPQLRVAIRKKIEKDADNAITTAYHEQVESSTKDNTLSNHIYENVKEKSFNLKAEIVRLQTSADLYNRFSFYVEEIQNRFWEDKADAVNEKLFKLKHKWWSTQDHKKILQNRYFDSIDWGCDMPEYKRNKMQFIWRGTFRSTPHNIKNIDSEYESLTEVLIEHLSAGLGDQSDRCKILKNRFTLMFRPSFEKTVRQNKRLRYVFEHSDDTTKLLFKRQDKSPEKNAQTVLLNELNRDTTSNKKRLMMKIQDWPVHGYFSVFVRYLPEDKERDVIFANQSVVFWKQLLSVQAGYINIIDQEQVQKFDIVKHAFKVHETDKPNDHLKKYYEWKADEKDPTNPSNSRSYDEEEVTWFQRFNKFESLLIIAIKNNHMILHDYFWTNFKLDKSGIIKSLKSEWQFMHQACTENPAAYKFFEGKKTAEIKKDLFEVLTIYEQSNGKTLPNYVLHGPLDKVKVWNPTTQKYDETDEYICKFDELEDWDATRSSLTRHKHHSRRDLFFRTCRAIPGLMTQKPELKHQMNPRTKKMEFRWVIVCANPNGEYKRRHDELAKIDYEKKKEWAETNAMAKKYNLEAGTGINTSKFATVQENRQQIQREQIQAAEQRQQETDEAQNGMFNPQRRDRIEPDAILQQQRKYKQITPYSCRLCRNARFETSGQLWTHVRDTPDSDHWREYKILMEYHAMTMRAQIRVINALNDRGDVFADHGRVNNDDVLAWYNDRQRSYEMQQTPDDVNEADTEAAEAGANMRNADAEAGADDENTPFEELGPTAKRKAERQMMQHQAQQQAQLEDDAGAAGGAAGGAARGAVEATEETGTHDDEEDELDTKNHGQTREGIDYKFFWNALVCYCAQFCHNLENYKANFRWEVTNYVLDATRKQNHHNNRFETVYCYDDLSSKYKKDDDLKQYVFTHPAKSCRRRDFEEEPYLFRYFFDYQTAYYHENHAHLGSIEIEGVTTPEEEWLKKQDAGLYRIFVSNFLGNQHLFDRPSERFQSAAFQTDAQRMVAEKLSVDSSGNTLEDRKANRGTVRRENQARHANLGRGQGKESNGRVRQSGHELASEEIEFYANQGGEHDGDQHDLYDDFDPDDIPSPRSRKFVMGSA